MFEWIRYTVQAAGGIDVDKAAKEKREKKEEKKLKRYIYSTAVKILTIVLGVLYLLISVVSIISIIENGSDLLYMAKYILLSIIDIVVLISLIFGKKKGEIVSIIGSCLFAIILFVSVSI